MFKEKLCAILLCCYAFFIQAMDQNWSAKARPSKEAVSHNLLARHRIAAEKTEEPLHVELKEIEAAGLGDIGTPDTLEVILKRNKEEPIRFNADLLKSMRQVRAMNQTCPNCPMVELDPQELREKIKAAFGDLHDSDQDQLLVQALEYNNADRRSIKEFMQQIEEQDKVWLQRKTQELEIEHIFTKLKGRNLAVGVKHKESKGADPVDRYIITIKRPGTQAGVTFDAELLKGVQFVQDEIRHECPLCLVADFDQDEVKDMTRDLFAHSQNEEQDKLLVQTLKLEERADEKAIKEFLLGLEEKKQAKESDFSWLRDEVVTLGIEHIRKVMEQGDRFKIDIDYKNNGSQIVVSSDDQELGHFDLRVLIKSPELKASITRWSKGKSSAYDRKIKEIVRSLLEDAQTDDQIKTLIEIFKAEQLNKVRELLVTKPIADLAVLANIFKHRLMEGEYRIVAEVLADQATEKEINELVDEDLKKSIDKFIEKNLYKRVQSHYELFGKSFTFEGNDKFIPSFMSFSPDGTKLIMMSRPVGKLVVFDTNSMQIEHQEKRDWGGPLTRYNNDGTEFLIASGYEVDIYNAATYQKRLSIKNSDLIHFINYNQDGGKLLVRDLGGVVTYDVQTGGKLATISVPLYRYNIRNTRIVGYSDAGTELAVYFEHERLLRIYDLITSELKKTIPLPEDFVHSIRSNYNLKSLRYSSTQDGDTWHLFFVQTFTMHQRNSELLKIKKLSYHVASDAFHADEYEMPEIMGPADWQQDVIRLIELNRDQTELFVETIYSIVMHNIPKKSNIIIYKYRNEDEGRPDHLTLNDVQTEMLFNIKKALIYYDVVNEKLLHIFKPEIDAISAISFSPDGTGIAFVSQFAYNASNIHIYPTKHFFDILTLAQKRLIWEALKHWDQHKAVYELQDRNEYDVYESFPNNLIFPQLLKQIRTIYSNRMTNAELQQWQARQNAAAAQKSYGTHVKEKLTAITNTFYNWMGWR